MSDWYYESAGERIGPVSEQDIKSLYANNVIKPETLVWTSEFGPSWKMFAETGLASSQQVAADNNPPPLPPKQAEGVAGATVSANAPASDSSDDFLRSELTKSLIGKKQDYYLAKWASLLGKSGNDPKAVVKTRSWNWPAFLIPYGWALYRKMYLIGGFIFAVQAAYVLLPEDAPRSLSRALGFGVFGASILMALYGNSFYFDQVFKNWKKLRAHADAAHARLMASAQGGVNWVLPILAFVVILGMAAVPIVREEGFELFASNVSCSSNDTVTLVQQIAREQIDKDAYMMHVVNSQGTAIKLNAIRTRSSGDAQAECAATIEYAIAFKTAEAANTGGIDLKGILQKALNKDITYTVERTDAGDQIYVTVYGLGG